MNVYVLDYHRGMHRGVLNEILCAWEDGEPLWTVEKGELIRAHVPGIVRIQHVLTRTHGISYKTVYTQGGRVRIRSKDEKCELLTTWGTMRILTQRARDALYEDVEHHLKCVSKKWYETVPLQVYGWLIRL